MAWNREGLRRALGSLLGTPDALRAAAVEGDLNTVMTLIDEWHTDPGGACSATGKTALHEAAAHGHVDVVAHLIGDGQGKEAVDVNAHDAFGNTPLHLAAYHGRARCVKLLVERCALCQVFAVDRAGATPLHRAAEWGRTEIVRLLCRAGADVEARDLLGASPLHLASAHGHAPCAAELLRLGAQRGARDLANHEPLHLAASPAVVQVLVTAGADRNSRTVSGATPLHAAAAAGNLGVLRELVWAGAALELKDRDGWTPLVAAADGGAAEAVGFLLAAGAALAVRDSAGFLPLHHAATAAVLMVLLEAHFVAGQLGSAVSAASSRKLATPPVRVRGGICVGKRYGPWLEALNDEHLGRWTPLHSAAFKGRAEVVECLLRLGADRSLEAAPRGQLLEEEEGEERGDTAVDVAKRNGHHDVASLLLTFWPYDGGAGGGGAAAAAAGRQRELAETQAVAGVAEARASLEAADFTFRVEANARADARAGPGSEAAKVSNGRSRSRFEEGT